MAARAGATPPTPGGTHPAPPRFPKHADEAFAVIFNHTAWDPGATLDDLSRIFGASKAAVYDRLQAAERKVISRFSS